MRPGMPSAPIIPLIPILPKNTAVGSPKYDINIDSDAVRDKYSLGSNKKALIIFPNPGIGLSGEPLYSTGEQYGLSTSELSLLYDALCLLGFEILVKSRGKHLLSENIKHLKGDRYFLDCSWFPHVTMELISVSDIVINFDSTVIKECVFGGCPILNFGLRNYPHYVKGYDFLYNYDYCVDLSKFPSHKKLIDFIGFLCNNNFEESFGLAIDRHLFPSGSVSEKILSHVPANN